MLEVCDNKILVSDDLFRSCIVYNKKISIVEQISIYDTFKNVDDIVLTFNYNEDSDITTIIYIHIKEINLFIEKLIDLNIKPQYIHMLDKDKNPSIYCNNIIVPTIFDIYYKENGDKFEPEIIFPSCEYYN